MSRPARPLSGCCRAAMTVGGDRDGTRYYVCDSCGNPCDAVPGDYTALAGPHD